MSFESFQTFVFCMGRKTTKSLYKVEVLKLPISLYISITKLSKDVLPALALC